MMAVKCIMHYLLHVQIKDEKCAFIKVYNNWQAEKGERIMFTKSSFHCLFNFADVLIVLMHISQSNRKKGYMCYCATPPARHTYYYCSCAHINLLCNNINECYGNIMGIAECNIILSFFSRFFISGSSNTSSTSSMPSLLFPTPFKWM